MRKVVPISATQETQIPIVITPPSSSALQTHTHTFTQLEARPFVESIPFKDGDINFFVTMSNIFSFFFFVFSFLTEQRGLLCFIVTEATAKVKRRRGWTDKDSTD